MHPSYQRFNVNFVGVTDPISTNTNGGPMNANLCYSDQVAPVPATAIASPTLQALHSPL